MNATNLTADAALDSAYLEVAHALIVLHNAQRGRMDVDLYGCTISLVADMLENVLIDMRAAGAETMDVSKMIECGSLYAMEQTQNDMRKSA